MSATYVMDNVQDNIKCVVYSIDGKHRPVANVTPKGVTQQCVKDGDIVVSVSTTHLGKTKVRVNEHGKTRAVSNQLVHYDKYVDVHDNEFLYNKEVMLPVNDTWNGEDTINSLVYEYGLHKFFTGMPDYSILGGLLGLDGDFETPTVGKFNIDAILNKQINDCNDVSDVKIKSLLENVDNNYVMWLIHDGISTKYKHLNWRNAERLPNMLSVSCILDNGKPVRFNDLIVWRGDDVEPEIVSVFDIATAFAMKKTNFLSMPYVIDEDVTRIMYIVHGDITSDSKNVAWLFRRR